MITIPRRLDLKSDPARNAPSLRMRVRALALRAAACAPVAAALRAVAQAPPPARPSGWIGGAGPRCEGVVRGDWMLARACT